MSKPKHKPMKIAKAIELFKAGRAFASKDGLIELDKSGKCLCHKVLVRDKHMPGTLLIDDETQNK